MKRISFTNLGVVLAILVGAVLLFIFMNSAEPSPDSTETSQGFARFLLSIFMPGFTEMSEEEQALEIAAHDHLIRKLAHMTEYAGLAFLVALLILQFLSMEKLVFRALALSVMLSMLYAVTDELHQIFVAGRTASLADVLIDTGGAIIGAIFAFLAHTIYKKICTR